MVPVVNSGVLEFPPGQDQFNLAFPLKQDMRHSSQLYRLLVRRQPRDDESEEEVERERPLANVELNVINDTGYSCLNSACSFWCNVLFNHSLETD